MTGLTMPSGRSVFWAALLTLASLSASACSALFDGDRFLQDGGPRPDAAFDGGSDVRDAGPLLGDGAVDSGSLDAGTDAGTDAGPLPPPPAANGWQIDPAFRVTDAELLGDGIVAVGTTLPLPGRQREGVVVHYRGDGAAVWAAQVGGTESEQLSGVASRDGAVRIGGVTRSYPAGEPSEENVLIVEATPTGVGRAWQWGTEENEFLWGLLPGGEIATWVGVGYFEQFGNRDGLVVAFDANITPLWAASFDAGEDDEFFSGVVVGDAIYATGSTGIAAGGDTHLFVAAITETEVRWARRSAERGAHGVYTTVDPRDGRVVVAGSVGAGQSSLLWFDAAGAVSGRTFTSLGSRLTGVYFDGDTAMATAGAFDDGEFAIHLATLSSTGSRSVRIRPGVATSGFLRTPIVTLGGVPRVVAHLTGVGMIDVPFTRAPETGCDVSVGGGTSEVIEETSMPTFTLPRVERTFVGSEIAGGLPVTVLSPVVEPDVCSGG